MHIASDRNLIDARFPVQWVIRPMTEEHHDYRGYAGQVAGGVLRPGDDVVVLPSGARTRIAGIDSFDGPLDAAQPPMSVTLRLEDELDVSRGDMIARAANQPTVADSFEATDLLDERAAARAGRALRRQAHDAHRARDAWPTCATGSTSTRCTASRTPTSSS